MATELENIVGLVIRDMSDRSVLTVLRHGDYSIGRAPDNDLQLENPTISSHHARIYTYLTASYIEDLNSKNGTFVNGKQVAPECRLNPGDRLSSQKILKSFTTRHLPQVLISMSIRRSPRLLLFS